MTATRSRAARPSSGSAPREHSSDHRLLAWLADEAGSELYTARVREIDTGADLADVVPDVSGAVVWTQDASAFYYVRLDQSHRPAGVFRHALGTPVAADVACSPRPIQVFLFPSTAIRRDATAISQLMIMKHRKRG